MDPIETTCESCGASLKAPSKLAGSTVSCPKCQKPVMVPTSEPIPQAPTQPMQPMPMQQPMPGQQMPMQQPMSGQPMPMQQPMPGQQMPMQQPMSGQPPMPMQQPMPGQPMPGQPMPGQPMPGQPMQQMPMQPMGYGYGAQPPPQPMNSAALITKIAICAVAIVIITGSFVAGIWFYTTKDERGRMRSDDDAMARYRRQAEIDNQGSRNQQRRIPPAKQPRRVPRAKRTRTRTSGSGSHPLIGKAAIPLDADAWVNGKALTDADLKGKVVLLDFWAVWCGPCIQTFPHLRKWHEEYTDKGLEIIGVTQYYSYDWNAFTKRPARVANLPPQKEQDALLNFARHHKLSHRLMVIPKGSSFTRRYRANAIPQVVLIDRKGKVRLVKVGAGESIAREINAKIDELLKESS